MQNVAPSAPPRLTSSYAQVARKPPTYTGVVKNVLLDSVAVLSVNCTTLVPMTYPILALTPLLLNDQPAPEPLKVRTGTTVTVARWLLALPWALVMKS